MAWTQFSIRWLIVAIAYVALAVVALFRPPSIWQPIFQAAVLGLLFVSVLGIIYRTGRQRAFWVGYLVFGLLAACLDSSQFDGSAIKQLSKEVYYQVSREISFEDALSRGWVEPQARNSQKAFSFLGVSTQPVVIPRQDIFIENAKFAWMGIFSAIGGIVGQAFFATQGSRTK